MTLTSSITEYDEGWPRLFEEEAGRLWSIFGASCVDIHHVGSTAVEGLVAKPEIDILVTVTNTSRLDRWWADLRGFGYRRGGDLMEGHHFFRRDVGAVRTHKLHICLSDHAQVSRMLGIRDHLRGNAADRKAYAVLKLRLERENRAGIAEYLEGKAPFLDDLYRRSQTQA
ncbi:GrpB family protein [uncultured Ruegeria sp.]|uniref:GrpB family protein n=1 Tax=uncultured Ruegeria sp. TaxID=259304 RepID=UPI0026059385|nr:GrpB family protein [uncultured Ruegeria sp.]